MVVVARLYGPFNNARVIRCWPTEIEVKTHENTAAAILGSALIQLLVRASGHGVASLTAISAVELDRSVTDDWLQQLG
jgi:hypothetical protein